MFTPIELDDEPASLEANDSSPSQTLLRFQILARLLSAQRQTLRRDPEEERPAYEGD